MLFRELMALSVRINIRKLTTGMSLRSMDMSSTKGVKEESDRMKKFHEKLKLEIPNDVARMNDPVLIDIDPESGEFIPESEKEPTKWGDWQHGGRVSDF